MAAGTADVHPAENGTVVQSASRATPAMLVGFTASLACVAVVGISAVHPLLWV